MRQGHTLREYDPKRGASVATLAYEYPKGYQVSEHAHGADQLIYAIRGLIHVWSGNRSWFIPPQFALWIPARKRHRLAMPSEVSMRTLYLAPGLVRRIGNGCCVLHVTKLLREVIVEVVASGQLRKRNEYERALCRVLTHCLETASPLPTMVTLPSDERTLKVAHAVLSEPGARQPLAGLCAEAGVSVRTIQRFFRKEVGIDFESWRRQVRLMKAIELLIAGNSVKQTALEVGYLQPSGFVEMFRNVFGTTPKVWTQSLRNQTAAAISQKS
jgi:AraC-like DNA-binding protein/quercetin dioxygenase-like cupin family protein